MTDLLAPDSPLFKVGDLVRIKEESWWLKKSPTFRGNRVHTKTRKIAKWFCLHDGKE